MTGWLIVGVLVILSVAMMIRVCRSGE